jgi:hypothetical protein
LTNALVDSSAAAKAAMSAGGANFLRAHPGANMSLTVYGTLTIAPGESFAGNWSVTLSTCSLGNSTGDALAGASFNAQVSKTTGSVLGIPVTNSSGCSAGGIVPHDFPGIPGEMTPPASTSLWAVLDFEPIVDRAPGPGVLSPF